MTAVYGVTPPSEFVAAASLRYAADGVPLAEIRRAQREVRDWSQWSQYWTGRAQVLDACADGSSSAASRYRLGVLASLCAHVAQYLHFDDVATKHAALHLKIDLYRKALLSAPHSVEEIEVPYRNGSVPAILHRPNVATPVPCVVYVGGLDAHKEDAHQFVELCLKRGLAVVAMDGPGQGEALLRGIPFDSGAHTAISSLFDVLTDHDRLTGDRIGLIGRSLGGYLAPRAAADDDRFRALVVWAAMWDLGMFPRLPTHTQAGFAHITGTEDPEVARTRLEFVNLSDHAARISMPTLLVHGENDTLTPVEHARRLATAIGETAELRVVVGSDHCNHDVAHIVRPAMADWLARQLS